MEKKSEFNKKALKEIEKDSQKLLDIKNKIDEKIETLNYSVADKKILPASGNKNDYHSIAIYAWPNPDTEDGLPYVLVDGVANPSNKTLDTDSIRIEDFSNKIMLMTILYLTYGEEKYIKKIHELLKIWFVDEETKMNPNMEYAQAIPGKVTGRGIGLIDARMFIRVIDYIEILDSMDKMDKELMSNIKKWFVEFIDWIENSKNGKDEEKAENNHGSWYEAEYTEFVRFIGDEKRLLSRVERYCEKVKNQITEDGDQPHEAKRKKAWHYFIFNLEAILIAHRNLKSSGKAELADEIQLIEKATDYLIRFLRNPEQWPKKDDSDFWNEKSRERKILPYLWEMSKGNPKYIEIVQELREKQKMVEIELLLNTQNDYTILFPAEV